jgi:hypothetical protein
MKDSNSGKQVAITGIVVPTDWDKDGNVVAVAISTPLEDEYVVDKNSLGQELLQFLGRKVLVKGMVTEDENWNKAITVVDYESLQDEDEEEYLDDEEEYYDEEEYEDEEMFEYQQEW